MRVSRTLPNVPFVVASSCASDRCAHASGKRRFAQRLYVKKSGSPVVIAMISFHDLSSNNARTGSEKSCNGWFIISSRKSFPDRADTNRTRQKPGAQKASSRKREQQL